MSLLRINKDPSRRQLFVFAAAWLAFVSVLGARSWMHSRPILAMGLWALAAAVPATAVAGTGVLRRVYLGLSYATYPVGLVVSTVVLALVYYLALTPIGLTMRLLGHDPLARRFDRKASSYWKPRAQGKSAGSYFNQG